MGGPEEGVTLKGRYVKLGGKRRLRRSVYGSEVRLLYRMIQMTEQLRACSQWYVLCRYHQLDFSDARTRWLMALETRVVAQKPPETDETEKDG